MKKFSVAILVALSLCMGAALAFAGETKGTVKSVDAAAGTVVLTVDGKDMTLKADKGVDLSAAKAGAKVTATVEGTALKAVKADAAGPKKAPQGC